MAAECTGCGATTPGPRRRGLCEDCRNEMLALGGQANLPVSTLPGRRFVLKVDMGGPIPADPFLGPCWTWKGSVNSKGYGLFRVSGDEVALAHRWSYEHATGEVIPEGWQVDHRCHDVDTCPGGDECWHRVCVNPEHLVAVPAGENNARSGSPTAHNGRKTHCDAGHEFDAQNTYVHPKRGTRHCRECQRVRAREWEQRQQRLVAQARVMRGQEVLFAVPDRPLERARG